jgi:hypothetical protein
MFNTETSSACLARNLVRMFSTETSFAYLAQKPRFNQVVLWNPLVPEKRDNTDRATTPRVAETKSRAARQTLPILRRK